MEEPGEAQECLAWSLRMTPWHVLVTPSASRSYCECATAGQLALSGQGMFEVIANDLDAPLAREYRRYMRSQVTAREQWCISILLVCCVPTATMSCCAALLLALLARGGPSSLPVHSNGPSIGHYRDCVPASWAQTVQNVHACVNRSSQRSSVSPAFCRSTRLCWSSHRLRGTRRRSSKTTRER